MLTFLQVTSYKFAFFVSSIKGCLCLERKDPPANKIFVVAAKKETKVFRGCGAVWPEVVWINYQKAPKTAQNFKKY
jgi:hypothetical protein